MNKSSAKPTISQPTTTSRSSICEIRPYLYIAGYRALSPKKLKDLGITHAIDTSNILKAQRAPEIEYLHIKIDDDDTSDIKQYFADTAAFIHRAKEFGGKILVYCAAGISRSATLCIMYLVIQENLSLRDAFHAVREARSTIYPNLAFWRQMVEYELEKRGESTVKLIKKQTMFIPDVYLDETVIP